MGTKQDVLSSPWTEVCPSWMSRFPSTGPVAQSAGASYDRRFSVMSSDSMDAGLSGGSSILSPPSLPSTPTYDDASRSDYLFMRQYPHMIPMTPQGKSGHGQTAFLDSSPMPHGSVDQDSPLVDYRLENLIVDSGRVDKTPPSAGGLVYGQPFHDFRSMRYDHRHSVLSPADSVDHNVAMSRAGPLMSSYPLMSIHDDLTVEANASSSLPIEAWHHTAFSNHRSPIHWTNGTASCNTVVPSSTVSSSFEGGYFSDNINGSFNSPEAIINGYDCCDEIDENPPGSESDSGWEPVTPNYSLSRTKSGRKIGKRADGPARRGPKKKEMKRVGPDFFKGCLKGTTTPVSAIEEPSKTEKCEFEDCGRSFNRKEHLRRHQKTHIGAKPYKCALPDEICTKAFGRTDNRTQHHATHLKAKPRNKPVKRQFLYECIRVQEGCPEKAEKAIAKLEQKLLQDEMEWQRADLQMQTKGGRKC